MEIQNDQMDQLEFEKKLYEYQDYKIYENESSSEPIANFVSRDYIHGTTFDQYNSLSKRELLWNISRYGEFEICDIVEGKYDSYYSEYLVEREDIRTKEKLEITNMANKIKAQLSNQCDSNDYVVDKQVSRHEKNIKIPYKIPYTYSLTARENLSKSEYEKDSNECKYVLPSLIRKVILATITKDTDLLQECCKDFHNDYIVKNIENREK